MLKYLSSYTDLSLLEAITRSQSLTLCFFKNFLVRYLRYLLDIGISLVTVTLVLSLDTLTLSPKTPEKSKKSLSDVSNNTLQRIRPSERHRRRRQQIFLRYSKRRTSFSFNLDFIHQKLLESCDFHNTVLHWSGAVNVECQSFLGLLWAGTTTTDDLHHVSIYYLRYRLI
jgi:hypothetical protein